MYNQDLEDKELHCADCNESFIFSAEDQQFFAQKGYSDPKRCPQCRSERKQRSNRSNDRSRGGGGGSSYNRPRYNVICSECGCETTVPFEPKNDRPVYCSDCYAKSY